VSDRDPCAGCWFNQLRGEGLPTINELIDGQVRNVDRISSQLPVGEEAVVLEKQERLIGNLGYIADRIQQMMYCGNPKYSLRIGRVSLITVCGKYWEDVSKLAALGVAFNPTIVEDK
jgi:hypothetical protein